MKYLVVSATALEIKPLLTELDAEGIENGKIFKGSLGDSIVHILVTGVGMMHTAYHLGTTLNQNVYDHVIQAGIAGAFDRDLQLAEVVEVSTQQYADLGFPGDEGFVDVIEMGLQDPDGTPYRHGKLLNPGQASSKHSSLKKVTGVSVNCISSSQADIDKIVSKYNPDVEVMEGIALHYACLNKKIEYSEIRAISNYVEVRNKKAWKIDESIEALNSYLIAWFRD